MNIKTFFHPEPIGALMPALRNAGPDTLFFCRRLRMEGDTELGLLVKNTLVALVMPPADLRAPLKIQISSFRRRPESSIFSRLDTGLRRCDKFLVVPLRSLSPTRILAGLRLRLPT